MTAQALLDRLDKVRSTGDRRWIARCPAHDDRTPSLSLRELEDGRVLVHCFFGCNVEAIVGAVGLKVEDLFPPSPPSANHVRGERRPWLPSDVLEVARAEVGVAAVILMDARKALTVAPKEFDAAALDRLLEASNRLDEIARLAYGR